MWNDKNDAILDLINLLEVPGVVFPAACPVCGKPSGHVYLHRLDNSHGGLWAWCSACESYAHMSGPIPKGWKNAPCVNGILLGARPDALDKIAPSIDHWVNQYIPINLPDNSDPLLRIKPFYGFATITFNLSPGQVCNLLEEEQLSFSVKKGDDTDLTTIDTHTVILIEDSIRLFFSSEKLLTMRFENHFAGALSNGIRLGISLNKALRADPSLQFDKNSNRYVSEQGYWIETDEDRKSLRSITIFSKAFAEKV